MGEGPKGKMGEGMFFQKKVTIREKSEAFIVNRSEEKKNVQKSLLRTCLFGTAERESVYA